MDKHIYPLDRYGAQDNGAPVRAPHAGHFGGPGKFVQRNSIHLVLKQQLKTSFDIVGPLKGDFAIRNQLRQSIHIRFKRIPTPP